MPGLRSDKFPFQAGEERPAAVDVDEGGKHPQDIVIAGEGKVEAEGLLDERREYQDGNGNNKRYPKTAGEIGRGMPGVAAAHFRCDP